MTTSNLDDDTKTRRFKDSPGLPRIREGALKLLCRSLVGFGGFVNPDRCGWGEDLGGGGVGAEPFGVHLTGSDQDLAGRWSCRQRGRKSTSVGLVQRVSVMASFPIRLGQFLVSRAISACSADLPLRRRAPVPTVDGHGESDRRRT